jgi:hypothetical protein
LKRAVDHPTNTTTIVVPIATTAAGHWRISPLHPWVSLWQELGESGVAGFYLIRLAAEKKIMEKLSPVK